MKFVLLSNTLPGAHYLVILNDKLSAVLDLFKLSVIHYEKNNLHEEQNIFIYTWYLLYSRSYKNTYQKTN